MKRIILGSLFLLCATPVLAQSTSSQQMALVGSPAFISRLEYLMAQQARISIFEAASDASHNGSDSGANSTDLNYTAGCHTLRARYATSVIASPQGTASAAAVLIVGSNFADSVIVGTVTGSGLTADSTASDLALAQAIKHHWNILAQCVTNP